MQEDTSNLNNKTPTSNTDIQPIDNLPQVKTQYTPQASTTNTGMLPKTKRRIILIVIICIIFFLFYKVAIDNGGLGFPKPFTLTDDTETYEDVKIAK